MRASERVRKQKRRERGRETARDRRGVGERQVERETGNRTKLNLH